MPISFPQLSTAAEAESQPTVVQLQNVPPNVLIQIFEGVKSYPEDVFEEWSFDRCEFVPIDRGGVATTSRYSAVQLFRDVSESMALAAIRNKYALRTDRQAIEMLCEAVLANTSTYQINIIGKLMVVGGVGRALVQNVTEEILLISDVKEPRRYTHLDLMQIIVMAAPSKLLIAITAIWMRRTGCVLEPLLSPYKQRIAEIDEKFAIERAEAENDPTLLAMLKECDDIIDVEHESNKEDVLNQFKEITTELEDIKSANKESLDDMQKKLSSVLEQFESHTIAPAEALRREADTMLPERYEPMLNKINQMEKQPPLATLDEGVKFITTWTPDMPAPTVTKGDEVLVCFVLQRTTRYYPADVLAVKPENGDLLVRARNAAAEVLPVTVTKANCAPDKLVTYRLEEGMRIVAHLENKNKPDLQGWYSGTVGQKAAFNNKNRYLVFFDNGSVRYVVPNDVRVHMSQPTDARGRTAPRLGYKLVPDMPIGAPNLRIFLQEYLTKFPELPLVKGKRGEQLCVKRNDRFQLATVIQVDAHLVLLHYQQEHVIEWLYRGSQRFKILQRNVNPQQAVRNARRRPTLRHHLEMASANNLYASPSVDRLAVDTAAAGGAASLYNAPQVAKKRSAISTADRMLVYDQQRRSAGPGKDAKSKEPIVDRTREHYTFITESIPTPITTGAYARHECSDKCSQKERNIDREMRVHGYGPFMLPLKQGWSRRIMSMMQPADNGRRRYATQTTKHQTFVYYVAPCGRRLRNESEIVEYLRNTNSLLTIDLFSFHPKLRPCVRAQARLKPVVDDYSYENERTIRVPVTNQVDKDLPPRVQYIARRYAASGHELDTAGGGGGKSKQADSGFCIGCDCIDDCADPSKCACQQLTKESIQRLHANLRPPIKKIFQTGYQNRRLNMIVEGILGGIYECNEKCQCSRTRCVNRVAQHDVKVPLELFKTDWKGWGVRTLVDIPPGQFICTYAGAVLTNEAANACKGGADFDAYYADLDLIEVIDDEKANLGLDETDEAIDMSPASPNDQASGDEEEDETGEESSAEVDDAASDVGARSDADSNYEFDGVPSESGDEAREAAARKSERLRTATHAELANKSLAPMAEDTSLLDAATVGATEAVGVDDLAPSASTSETDPNAATVQPKKRQPFSWYKYYAEIPQSVDDEDAGKDKFGFTLDARVKGNIGRFFNHSCEPNIFVQNVLVDTHDLRLPWIAFFAKRFVNAGEELCWNYGYEIDYSQETKIECKCGTRSCRKRLL